MNNFQQIENYYYWNFDSLKENELWTNSVQFTGSRLIAWEGVSGRMEQQIERGWFGPNVKTLDQVKYISQFQDINLLKSVSEKLKAHLKDRFKKYDQKVIESKKLAYNSKGFGVFSFDRAAMGLYRNASMKIGTPILNTVTSLDIELGNDKIKTSVKEVYAYFPNKEKESKAITIYVSCGGLANVEGDKMLYTGLGAATLTEYLENIGFAVEVVGVLNNNYNDDTYISLIKIKKFKDRLDKNLIALLTSDPAYFRYKGFKSLIAMSEVTSGLIPGSLGKLGNYTDFLEKYTQKHAKGQAYYVFGQQYSLNDVSTEIQNIISDATAN